MLILDDVDLASYSHPSPSSSGQRQSCGGIGRKTEDCQNSCAVLCTTVMCSSYSIYMCILHVESELGPVCSFVSLVYSLSVVIGSQYQFVTDLGLVTIKNIFIVNF